MMTYLQREAMQQGCSCVYRCTESQRELADGGSLGSVAALSGGALSRWSCGSLVPLRTYFLLYARPFAAQVELGFSCLKGCTAFECTWSGVYRYSSVFVFFDFVLL